MSTNAPSPAAPQLPRDARVAVVAARFNTHIVDEMLAGCLRRLIEHGITEHHFEVHRVPGAFELPVAAKVLAATKRFHAVVCLGCVIRGDTPHFDYVAGEAARGIQQVAVTEALPVIFGVLTTNTEEQARQRIGGSHGHAGERAADAAAEMIAMVEATRRATDVPITGHLSKPPAKAPSKSDPFFSALIDRQRG
jgi:6,7-dimethyl-8-ribityllumazine synthase